MFISFLLGCNLSPLLFALFINKLGADLNSSGLGINLGSLNISALFFADDILLIGKSRSDLSKLMEITRVFCKNHRLALSDTKSKIIHHNSETGKTTFHGPAEIDPLTLEAVISFKYLGIPINCTPRNLFKNYNEQVKQRANSYLASVLSLVKTGPDRADLAYTLWTSCALPSILYGCEVMPLLQGTINEVEKCQVQVGKFILQIPRNSASVASSLDAGLKPVWAVIAEKVLLYANTIMSKPESYWPKVAMNENVERHSQSPYTKNLMQWRRVTGSIPFSPRQIKASVHRAAIASVFREQKGVSVTTFAMNGPISSHVNSWFKPKAWVSDSSFSKIFAEFRACNSSLGNRGPAKDGQFYKLCPLCSKIGITALNNEVKT